MASHRFPKSMRLLRACEFEHVLAARKSAGNDLLVLYGAANDFGYPRLGLTVSRKVGPAARRNRWKRVVREVFRLVQDELPNLDLVCIPRSREEPQFGQLLKSLPALAVRIDRQLRRPRETAPRDHT
jgi:ribonuclease P protein component